MAGLFKPFFLEAARHAYKLVTDSAYRQCALLEARLSRVRRFVPCQVKWFDWDLSVPDSASFLSACREIYVEKIYDFPSLGANPRILDLGANIGLSVLFFKNRYPDCKVTAFEPDPKIFKYLEKNIRGNGYSDVELLNQAAWTENCCLNFYSEGADGGHVLGSGSSEGVDVNAIDLAAFLREQSFDFLKMDIEGSEAQVFPAIQDELSSFKYIFLEYHSVANQKQCLGEIMRILEQQGFRIHCQSVHSSSTPFVSRVIHSGFDMQLNLFGWRE